MQTVTLSPFFVKQAGHLVCIRVKQVSRDGIGQQAWKLDLLLPALPEKVL
jgi:hypothetical protein